ncbi:MAG: hypothetical protein PHN49_09810 [Candidatus Omnitrophica bacterium]|nr:hypothetical protein [Candidatus Omnitrophota bacterium]MDD5671924.1 hypothetical protein [Candidatus Omnitrophota bacterium]
MKLKKILIFVLPIAFAMMIHGFVALHWRYSFNSDEAAVGMRSFHLVENGRLEVSAFRKDYYGDLPQIIQAPVLRLTGHNVVVIRIFALIYLLLFFILHAILTTRLLGARTAAISLVFMALASLPILTDTTMFYFFLWPALNLAALLCLTITCSDRFRHLRQFLIGFLLGLALWCTGQTYIYGLVTGIIFLLGSEEWEKISASIVDYAGKTFGIPAKITRFIVFAVILFLFLHSFISNDHGCHVARKVLLAFVAGIGIAILTVSRRKKSLVAGGSNILLGFVLGMSPRIYDVVFFGNVPHHKGVFVMPTDGRVSEFIRNILPFLFGAPSPLEMGMMPGILWTFFAAVMAGCFIAFVWGQRAPLMKLVTLSHIDRQDRGAIIFMLLFVITVLANLCYFFPVLCTRYAIVAWPVAAVIVAFSLSRLIQRYRKAGIVLAAFLVILLFQQRFKELSQIVYASHVSPDNKCAQSNMDQLQDFLSKHGIDGGYAGFWQAYVINFLTQEKYLFAPWENYRRYPGLERKAQSGSSLAYLVGPLTDFTDVVSPRLAGGTSVETLLNYYQEIRETGTPLRPGFIEHLQKQKIIMRQTVGVFDVWILTNDR